MLQVAVTAVYEHRASAHAKKVRLISPTVSADKAGVEIRYKPKHYARFMILWRNLECLVALDRPARPVHSHETGGCASGYGGYDFRG